VVDAKKHPALARAMERSKQAKSGPSGGGVQTGPKGGKYTVVGGKKQYVNKDTSPKTIKKTAPRPSSEDPRKKAPIGKVSPERQKQLQAAYGRESKKQGVYGDSTRPGAYGKKSRASKMKALLRTHGDVLGYGGGGRSSRSTPMRARSRR
jgi:hypothetical protein